MAAGDRTTLRAALRGRDFRLLLGGLAVSKAGDWLYVVGLQVFVFEQTHSAAWVAATTVLRLVPAGILAPLGGALADRYERRTVMIACDLARAVLMVGLAAVAWRTGSAAAALGLAFASSAAGSPYLPAASAMTPSVVPESELASANSALSIVDNVAIVAGPALGGLLLALGSPAAAFLINSVSFLGSAAAVFSMRSRSRAEQPEEPVPLGEQLREGLRAVTSSPGVTAVCGFVAGSSLMYGLETVLLVLVADRQLGRGADSYGFLLAAVGFGGVLAGLASGRLAGYDRPTLVLTVALLAMGVPLAALSLVHQLAAALPILALEGTGNIIVDVTAFTLLQRALPQALMARVFGLLETAIIASILAGALVAPALVALVGLQWSLVAAGLAVPALALATLPLTRGVSLAALQSFQATRARFELLTRLGIFEGVPRPAIELLARSAEAETAAAGSDVVRQGDPAGALYVVESGELDVLVRKGREESLVNHLRGGDYFGEIGLLQQVPRTATVRAVTDVTLYRLDGDEFLAAVNQAPSVSGVLLDGMAASLARGAAVRRRRTARSGPKKEATAT